MSNGNEVVIRVVLDTTQPQREVEEIGKNLKDKGKETERTLADRLKGLGMMAGGVALGATLANTKTSFGTVLGETIGPYASQFENWVFGGQQINARAAAAAREQTIQTMAYDVGVRGYQPGHRSYFEHIKAQRDIVERGRQIIESKPEMYGQFDFEKAWDRLSTAIADGAKSAVDYLLSKL